MKELVRRLAGRMHALIVVTGGNYSEQRQHINVMVYACNCSTDTCRYRVLQIIDFITLGMVDYGTSREENGGTRDTPVCCSPPWWILARLAKASSFELPDRAFRD